ncbi:hypothetical protein GIB67_015067 [Kingdonia uniflora]|uniref:Thaumatin-like protein n=1 Tax=Kingdonia uniflora TaxID=39325 RepID=A0A7J7NNB8_9MAGN|nr:hypothetical protein GIB67_015067 [Kingdonia uniflora]
MRHWGLRLGPNEMQWYPRGNPHVSFAEFTLGGFVGNDFYDVSLADGFNLPVFIAPHSLLGCNSTSCPADINSLCLAELSVKGPDASTVSLLALG